MLPPHLLWRQNTKHVWNSSLLPCCKAPVPVVSKHSPKQGEVLSCTSAVGSMCLDVHVRACMCMFNLVQTSKEPELVLWICYSGLPRKWRKGEKGFPNWKACWWRKMPFEGSVGRRGIMLVRVFQRQGKKASLTFDSEFHVQDGVGRGEVYWGIYLM